VSVPGQHGKAGPVVKGSPEGGETPACGRGARADWPPGSHRPLYSAGGPAESPVERPLPKTSFDGDNVATIRQPRKVKRCPREVSMSGERVSNGK